jgi:hypothetical protein
MFASLPSLLDSSFRPKQAVHKCTTRHSGTLRVPRQHLSVSAWNLYRSAEWLPRLSSKNWDLTDNPTWFRRSGSDWRIPSPFDERK